MFVKPRQRMFLFTSIFALQLYSSELIDVLPLTDSILMLHFDDGHVIHHKKHQRRSDETIVIDPLNVQAAMNPLSYKIAGSKDKNFKKGVHPSGIGRKSKGTDFAWFCDNWDPEKGCVNDRPDHAKEHWIYLFLPHAMKGGTGYTIEMKGLSGDRDEVSFTNDARQLRSEAVHVNQLGYLPAAPAKFGYVYHWMGDKGGLDLADYAGNHFYLVETKSREPVFQGNMKFRKSADNAETIHEADTPNRNFLAADVYECDFSEFSREGSYVLSVEGIGCSFPFEISDRIYIEPYKIVTKGLYLNRSGIELTEPYTKYVRPAPHHPKITPGFAGKMKYTTSRWMDWEDENHSRADLPAIEDGILGDIDVWGWYQDAGDWDSYYSHTDIPAMMLALFEIADGEFCDSELNIPESGNGLPDFLDEARWQLRMMNRVRHEILKKGYGTGGLGTRICGDHFGGDGEGVPSYEDTSRTYIVSGEDPISTFKYAGLAAQMDHCLKLTGKGDPEGIDWLKEAEEAYAWALENTRPGDEDIRHYRLLHHTRLYAASALFRTTRDPGHYNQIQQDSRDITPQSVLFGDARWAAYVFMTSWNRDHVPYFFESVTTRDRLLGAALRTADYFTLESAEKRACRWGGQYDYPMLVGHGTTPLVIEAILGYGIAKKFKPEKCGDYARVILTTCDYFCGNNPLNMTWMHRIGERWPEHVFHMDSFYNGLDELPPGLIPYGPWTPFDAEVLYVEHPDWAFKTIYPEDIHQWPGHERWFANRCSPLHTEFTVHQNTVVYAVTFAFINKIIASKWMD